MSRECVGLSREELGQPFWVLSTQESAASGIGDLLKEPFVLGRLCERNDVHLDLRGLSDFRDNVSEGGPRRVPAVREDKDTAPAIVADSLQCF